MINAKSKKEAVSKMITTSFLYVLIVYLSGAILKYSSIVTLNFFERDL